MGGRDAKTNNTLQRLEYEVELSLRLVTRRKIKSFTFVSVSILAYGHISF
jgi:hypothetical protein